MSVLDAAFAELGLHVAGRDGWCVGCLAVRAQLSAVPCWVARRALSVVETHGVSEWDAGPLLPAVWMCEGCAGRGWKFVAARRRVWVEDVAGWVRRRCVDCGGAGADRRSVRLRRDGGASWLLEAG